MQLRTATLFISIVISCVFYFFNAFSVAHAETIEFAEEELARESVLPVFDKTVVVRNRTVTLDGRLELGVGLGLNATEPLYEQMSYDFYGTYHLSEVHGVNVLGVMTSTDLSQAGRDLRAGKGLQLGAKYDASLAPALESLYFVNYQFSAYYGKMSITKSTSVNLTLYGLLGVGLANWSDASTFAADFGVGQKLYFSNHFGMRFDLFFAMYTGPDITDPKSGNSMTTGGPELGSDAFSSTFYFRPFLLSSLFYIF